MSVLSFRSYFGSIKNRINALNIASNMLYKYIGFSGFVVLILYINRTTSTAVSRLCYNLVDSIGISSVSHTVEKSICVVDSSLFLLGFLNFNGSSGTVLCIVVSFWRGSIARCMLNCQIECDIISVTGCAGVIAALHTNIRHPRIEWKARTALESTRQDGLTPGRS